MQRSFTASGKREAAKQLLAQAIKNAGGGDKKTHNHDDWPLLVAARDRVFSEVDQLATVDDDVSISLSLTSSISVTKATAAPEAAGKKK